MKRLTPLLIALALLGCQSSSNAANPASAPAAASKSSHVFVIVMENKEYGDVIGSSSAPYVNALARRYAAPTRFYGVSHPSLPNYLALTAGTTFGVQSDCTDCQQSGASIVDQLESAGRSWKAYMGGMPQACFKGASSGGYAKKHDPFMYYRRVADNPARCAKVVPEARLAADLRAGRLPSYGFLAPSLCDDTHDCSVASGDSYLARIVPPILKGLGPHGFLVLTWDEGSSGTGGGGHIATVIAGPGVKRGARPASTYNHYSTLRTIEDALGLKHLGHAADAGVKSFGAAFRGGVPPIR
jgi:hypothetical protein